MLQNKERSEVGFGIKFIKQMYLLLRIIFPSFRCKSVVFLFSLLIMLTFGEVLAYHVGLISSWYYKALPRRDYDLFEQASIYATLYVVGMALVNAINSLIKYFCYLHIRRVVTNRLHQLYFAGDNFYKICVFTSIDNPDQRIAQDVDRLSLAVMQILNLVLNPFTIAFYTYKVYERAGGLALLFFYVFFLIFTIGNRILVGLFAKFYFDQQKCEGNFRFRHAQVREQAEAVAFTRGGTLELHKVQASFENLLSVQHQLIIRESVTKLWTGISDYLGSIVSYLSIAAAIFNGPMKDIPMTNLPSEISRFSFFNFYLIHKFTTLIDASDQAIDIAGNAHRIITLIKRLERMQLERSSRLPASISEQPSSGHREGDILLELKGLTYGVPGHAEGEFLVKDLSLTVRSGRHLLITGRSGVGKSSLLRVIRGLWSTFSIRDLSIIWRIQPKDVEDPSSVLFLPQRSYLTSGNLLDLIYFPRRIPTTREIQLEELAFIGQLFCDFGLESLLNRVGGLQGESSDDWESILSPGEQQRVAMVRLCHHKPLLAFLDEATCHIDEEAEQWIYRKVQSFGITTVSIGHRDSLRPLHRDNLNLLCDGSWTVSEETTDSIINSEL